MPEHDHEGAATNWIAGSRDADKESRSNIKAQGVFLGLFLFVESWLLVSLLKWFTHFISAVI